MMKIDFKDLEWPRAMNLSVLQRLLPTDAFQRLILAFLDKDRKVRRIQLPSRKCAKKIIAYAYGKAVQDGKATWDEVMEELKKDGTLKSMGINRKSLRRLFFSRQKEIIKEIKNEQ